MDSLVQGFKSMVPAICILALAWALGGICRNELNLGGNIAVLLEGSSFLMFMPVVLFILGAFIGFATGTSWGTMAILIPLSEGIFGLQDGGEATTLLIICIAAAAMVGSYGKPRIRTQSGDILAGGGARIVRRGFRHQNLRKKEKSRGATAGHGGEKINVVFRAAASRPVFFAPRHDCRGGRCYPV